MLDERESVSAATFAAAKGGEPVGLTKRGKGARILAIVDCHRLPLSVSTHVPSHHEVALVLQGSSITPRIFTVACPI